MAMFMSMSIITTEYNIGRVDYEGDCCFIFIFIISDSNYCYYLAVYINFDFDSVLDRFF